MARNQSTLCYEREIAPREATQSKVLVAVSAASGDEPPGFEVPATGAGNPLIFVAYGDSRITQRDDVVRVFARRTLVAKIADENPAAILIGGDLVYEGSNPLPPC